MCSTYSEKGKGKQLILMWLHTVLEPVLAEGTPYAVLQHKMVPRSLFLAYGSYGIHSEADFGNFTSPCKGVADPASN